MPAAIALKDSGDAARPGDGVLEEMGVCSRSKWLRKDDTGF